MPDKPVFKIVFSELAKDQILDLFEFYESVSHGLGEDFMENLGNVLEGLQTNPRLWQFASERENRIRRAVLMKPKVVILYEVENDQVFIGSIRDSRSNWK